VAHGAAGNTIGGQNAPRFCDRLCNRIAFNSGNGVTVGLGSTDAATIGNRVEENLIYANKLGIDLGNNGVTTNHASSPARRPQRLPELPGTWQRGARERLHDHSRHPCRHC
jgi:hypothetical protein